MKRKQIGFTLCALAKLFNHQLNIVMFALIQQSEKINFHSHFQHKYVALGCNDFFFT